MNIHKHMEAIFVVALSVIGFGSLMLDGVAEAGAGTGASVPVLRADAAPGANPAMVMCAAKPARHA